MSLLDDINNGNVPVYTDDGGRQYVIQQSGMDGIPVYLDTLLKQMSPANSYQEQAKGLLGKWSSLADMPQVQRYLSQIDTPEELAYMQAKFDPTKVPHLEELTYQLAGFGDQKNIDAWEKQQSGQQTTALENMLIDNPSMAGQSVVRPDIPDLYQGVANPNAADGGPAYTQALYDKYGVTEADYSQAATDWATNNTAAAQAARDTDDGFGALLGIGILLAVGVATGGFGLAGVGAEAGALGAIGGTGAEALAAADLAAGLGAAEAVGGTVAATAATGASVADIALGAARGAAVSAATGGDPLQGALTGGFGTFLNGTGVLNTLTKDIGDTLGITSESGLGAVKAGLTGATTAGVSTAIQGGDLGDVLKNAATAGLASGAANYVGNAVRGGLDGIESQQNPAAVDTAEVKLVDGAEDTLSSNEVHGTYNDGIYFNPTLSNTVANVASNTTGNVIGAVANGGDIGDALERGIIGGVAGGVASDLGAGAGTAGVVTSTANNVVADAQADDNLPTTPQQNVQSNAFTLGLSFSDLLPQYQELTRRDMNWGARLSGRP